MTPTAASLTSAALGPLVARLGRSWVTDQRERHRPLAGPVEPDRRAALEPFFAGWVLDAVRVRVVERIDPPPLVGTLTSLGIPLPLEIDRIAGIAFVDTVALLDSVPEPGRTPLLFHELVHVVQYRELGVRGFVERYVAGWLAGGRRYAAIPLERDAYALQRRFRAAAEPFDAESEILRLLGVGRQ